MKKSAKDYPHKVHGVLCSILVFTRYFAWGLALDILVSGQLPDGSNRLGCIPCVRSPAALRHFILAESKVDNVALRDVLVVPIHGAI